MGESGNKEGLTVSKVLGWGLIGLGALSVLDMGAPVPVPTVGPVAIVTGLIFAATGGFILLKSSGRLAALFKDSAKTLLEPTVKIDPMLPVRILKLARQKGGILTVSMVAIELDLPLNVAEAGLDECARMGQASADFDMQKEIKYYKFHEQLPQTSP